MTTKPLLIALLLIVQSSFVFGQTENNVETKDSLSMAGGILTVPEGMYRLVESWTLQEERDAD